MQDSRDTSVDLSYRVAQASNCEPSFLNLVYNKGGLFTTRYCIGPASPNDAQACGQWEVYPSEDLAFGIEDEPLRGGIRSGWSC